MPTELEFVKNQNRSQFNNFMPFHRSFDDNYVDYNKRVPLQPASEVDRQTGSGRAQWNNNRFLPPFVTMPVPTQMQGTGGMKNNFDPSVPAPLDKIYTYLPKLQFTSPIINRIHNPLQRGSGHSVGNPAVNNWMPAKIPEPGLRIYEYTPTLQVHSAPVDPIRMAPNRGHLIQGRLSDDDHKTGVIKHYNQGQFSHVSKNQLVYKN